MNKSNNKQYELMLNIKANLNFLDMDLLRNLNKPKWILKI